MPLMRSHFLGFDLGAESGRAVLGRVQAGRLELEEISRFAIEPVEVAGVLHWNILSIYREMQAALRRCAAYELAGIGIDSWSMDFGLLAADGTLLGDPVHYRDRRTIGMDGELLRRIPLERIHRTTGMSLTRIQTACQLLSM